MIIRPFDNENIALVMGNLWPRGRHEIEKWGFTVDELKNRFTDMIGKPWTFAFYDTEPCALGFMEPIGKKKWRTIFAATEEGFNRIWLPMTIFMRRLSGAIVKDGGVIECTSGNPDAQEWFESMGFKLIFRNDTIDKYAKFGKMNQAIGHGAI